MINAINLHSLRNDEYLQFMNDVLRIVHTYQANDELQSSVQAGTLSIAVAELELLLHTDGASPLSHDIARLDTARDRLITGLVKLCDAHTYGPDPEKRIAADTLSASLAKYGAGIAQQGYQAETAIITNILTDWSTHPDLTKAAARIGAEEWLTALNTANEGFIATYHQRTAAMAEITPPETVRSVRMETNDAWYKLRDRLDSFFTIHEGAAPWSTAIAHINALIDQYKSTLGIRAGRVSAARNADENQVL